MFKSRALVSAVGVIALTAAQIAAEPTDANRKAGRSAPQPIQVQTVETAAKQLQDGTSQTSRTAMTGEQLKWQVLSGGGGKSSGGSYVMHMTIGQTAVGMVTGTGYKLNQGFWQNFVQSCCIGITGNLDGDPGDLTDGSDLQTIVDYIFFLIPIPGTCFEENDVQKDLAVDPSDLQALVDYIFFNFDPYTCP